MLLVIEPQGTHLINSQDLPFDLLQILSVFENKFVCRKKDIELQVLQWSKFKLSNNVTRPSRAHVTNNVQFRRPPFELGLPSRDGRERDDDKEWAILVLGVEEVREKRNGLDGFTKTHLQVEGALSTFVLC